MDCDGGGIDNATECDAGTDPNGGSPQDDCDAAISEGVDIRAIVIANPMSPLATADCDGGGIDNATECANGDNPLNPNDDYDCDSFAASGLDLCDFLNDNPNSSMATLDCDGGGVDNATECASGNNPFNANDDINCDNAIAMGIDICTYILGNPNSACLLYTSPSPRDRG